MLARMCLFAILICGSAAAADIAPVNRVPNANPGVCFWACLESAGRQQGVEAAYGLRDEVISTGIGRDFGARRHEIAYWALRRGFTLLKIAPQPLDGVRYRTDRGQLIVATCKNWFDQAPDPNHDGSHAVVVLDVSAQRLQRPDGSGRLYYDHWVTYYDPNKPQNMLVPWHAFAARYVEGYVIEPLGTLSPRQLDTAVQEFAAGGTDVHLPTLRRLPPTPAVPLLVRWPLEVRTASSGGGVDLSAPQRPATILVP